jgi:hypothetical protein
MKSPFKFLDAYTWADREAFFGREEETENLYQMVFKSPLMLVYGQSGTGKTSLVQCGLASRFDGADWNPFLIRRQDNLNDSIRQALDRALPQGETPKGSLLNTVAFLFRFYLRPVYLIIDQLEELFILGTEEEQENFAKNIQALVESELACKVILVIREEYLGHLYDLEKYLPSVFDHRLRVEPMGLKKVGEVLEKSAEKFNISFEKPEKNIRSIYDKLSAGKSGVQLPYLQVYLDLLYREDFQRTYPDLAKQGKLPQPLPKLTFSTAEIEHFGGIEDVLGRFLQEQERDLQRALNAEFPPENPQALALLLDALVTEAGTKRPLRYEQNGTLISLQGGSETEWLRGISKECLTFLIQKLRAARILRDHDGSLELAHDALAALIDERRSNQQRRRNETWTRLQNNYREYQDTGEFLSRKQLLNLEDFLPEFQPRLEPKVWQYIQQSQAHNDALEKAELLAERRKRRITMQVAAALLVLALLASAASVYAFQARNRLALALFETQVKTARIMKTEGRYGDALDLLGQIWRSDLQNSQQKSLDDLQKTWQEIQTKVQNAETQMQQENTLSNALATYQEALGLEPDERLKQVLDRAEKYRDSLVQVQYNLAISPGIPANVARAACEHGLRMKPGEPRLSKKLKELGR